MIKGVYTDLDALLQFRHRKIRSRTPPRMRSRKTGGHRISKMRGRGMDFAEVRLYQAGDDVRNIDWRVTARKAKTHTKVFEEERERPTLILCDQSQSMFFGSAFRLKSVAAAEAASVLAWHALNHGNRVGGLVIDNQSTSVIKPRRSTRTVVRFLTMASTANRKLNQSSRAATASSEFVNALVQTKKIAHNGHQIFIVSDFSTSFDLWRPHILALKRHNDVALVQVTDPLEAELPPANLYAVTDGESRMLLDTGNRQLRTRYANRYQSSIDQIMDFCLDYGIHYTELSTTEAAEDCLSTQLISYAG